MVFENKPIYPNPVITEIDWNDERCSSDKLFWVYVSDEKLSEFKESEAFEAVAATASRNSLRLRYLEEFALYHMAEAFFASAFIECGLKWETSFAECPALWGTVAQECCDWTRYKGYLVKGRADFAEDAAALRKVLEAMMRQEIDQISSRPKNFRIDSRKLNLGLNL